MARLPSCDGRTLHAFTQFLSPHQAQQINPVDLTRQGDRGEWPFSTSKTTRRRHVGPICSKESGHPYPFDDSDPLTTRFPSQEGLPLSLYTPFEELPPDGKTQTDKERLCDPMVQSCQTPTYVYEDPCSLCKGTGRMEMKYKGHNQVYACTMCQGLGYVRRTTTRFIPDVNGTGPKMTLNRRKETKELPSHLQNGHMRDGFMEL